MLFSSTFLKVVFTITVISQAVLAAPTDSIQTQALNAHNSLRAKHHVAGLRWNQALANHATAVSRTCNYAHNAKGTGQNLAWGRPSLEASIQAWYDESQFYDYNTGRSRYSNKSVGHFTQVVWKGTTEIGCGSTYCAAKKQYFYVCDYSAAGNMAGGQAANVIRP
ncbi:CAP domain-containing protein [Mucor mucedo]|uniref:CAP domain-containing protein n=1 Tax=Mucor mucedo TaxID=29922 RepID=UPI00221F35D8|nr:CAP domain-containing protein [Mucor mucedo]KAI7864709.1 CAP domain-containing protein [Mucor mucedo]